MPWSLMLEPLAEALLTVGHLTDRYLRGHGKTVKAFGQGNRLLVYKPVASSIGLLVPWPFRSARRRLVAKSQLGKA